MAKRESVLYASEWVKITHHPENGRHAELVVEFPRTNAPGFRCGVDDAHELGQALFHVARKRLEAEVGHPVPPMPGFAVPGN